jgi:hypothetical protein
MYAGWLDTTGKGITCSRILWVEGFLGGKDIIILDKEN